jgi:hypothetical protein
VYFFPLAPSDPAQGKQRRYCDGRRRSTPWRTTGALAFEWATHDRGRTVPRNSAQFRNLRANPIAGCPCSAEVVALAIHRPNDVEPTELLSSRAQ